MSAYTHMHESVPRFAAGILSLNVPWICICKFETMELIWFIFIYFNMVYYRIPAQEKQETALTVLHSFHVLSFWSIWDY